MSTRRRGHVGAPLGGRGRPLRTTQLLPEVVPTGNRTSAVGAHVFHWSGDRVSEAWHLGDWLGWLTKAGALPPLPGTGA